MAISLPVALAIASVAVAAGGTAYAAVQQQNAAKQNARLLNRQAEAEAQAAELEARQEAQNAAIAEMEAAREAEAQKFRERREREKQRFLAGHIRATTAASGLLLEGSPLYVLQENLRQAELGLLSGRAESESRQVALRREASQRRYGADVLRYQGAERLRLGRYGANIAAYQGDQAFKSGLVQSGGTLLSGASSAYTSYKYGQYLDTRRAGLTTIGGL